MSLVNVMRRGARMEADELPTGTVTFLLTDVEASSASWVTDEEATDARLCDMDDQLRSCVSRNSGTLIKSRGEGDSAFAVFDRASEAVTAAFEAQIALSASNNLRVRAAIHTGEVRLRDGDYYGIEPNRAARLRTLANGGQIVVSRVSAELAEGQLPAEIKLVALGSYRIRDWPRAVQLFGVKGPGLRQDFPPLHMLGDAQQALMTIVMVDVVGSSAAIKGLTDPELIDVHRFITHAIRDAFEAHGGSFLKMNGDGCLAAFDHPAAALVFARALVRGTDANIRVAAQTGLVELIGEDMVGRVIYGAHALSKQAGIGELVTTGATVELLAGQGLTFTQKPRSDDGTDVFTIDLRTEVRT